MQVTFLIGGTGNQLFQFATANEKSSVSTLFLGSKFRKALNWTDHEQLFSYKEASLILTIFALVLMCVDFAFLKVANVTIWTHFDTRKLKSQALWHPAVRLGYFQSETVQRNIGELAKQIPYQTAEGAIALHIRGGDLLALEREGRNQYGLLDAAYYRKSVAVARDAIGKHGRAPTSLLVLTDDPDYASRVDLDVEGVPKPNILSVPLKQTMSRALGAEWFVSSNSTMSYWIIQLREGRSSIAPLPFQKRGDYNFNDGTDRLPAPY